MRTEQFLEAKQHITLAADWHIAVNQPIKKNGTFHGTSPEQAAEIIQTIKTNPDIGALVLVGDFINRDNPRRNMIEFGRVVDGFDLPIIVIAGNHENPLRRKDSPDKLKEFDAAMAILPHLAAQLHVLQGNVKILLIDENTALGITGVEGGGGGNAELEDLRDPKTNLEKRAFHGTEKQVNTLEKGLRKLVRLRRRKEISSSLVATHFASTPTTVFHVGDESEHKIGWVINGSILLGRLIDEYWEKAHVQLAFHGHAHLGKLMGATEEGHPVANVAHPVLEREFADVASAEFNPAHAFVVFDAKEHRLILPSGVSMAHV